MTFSLKRTVDLSEFGWEGCSIDLKAATYKEVLNWQKDFANLDPDNKEVQQKVFSVIEDHFISGTGQDEEGKKVQITNDNLMDLPLDIILKCIYALQGANQNPNS